ncbi:MAG: leader peptide processing enzyme [Spirochaetales bacterium]|nr:leader peptide processing enzyme [Spirochaetales bacterium]
MNKIVNTILFIFVATIVNIIIMIALFLIPYILLALILRENMEHILIVLWVVLPLFAMGGGLFIYSKIMNYISAKIDMQKYFHPIIKPKK